MSREENNLGREDFLDFAEESSYGSGPEFDIDTVAYITGSVAGVVASTPLTTSFLNLNTKAVAEGLTISGAYSQIMRQEGPQGLLKNISYSTARRCVAFPTPIVASTSLLTISGLDYEVASQVQPFVAASFETVAFFAPEALDRNVMSRSTSRPNYVTAFAGSFYRNLGFSFAVLAADPVAERLTEILQLEDGTAKEGVEFGARQAFRISAIIATAPGDNIVTQGSMGRTLSQAFNATRQAFSEGLLLNQIVFGRVPYAVLTTAFMGEGIRLVKHWLAAGAESSLAIAESNVAEISEVEQGRSGV